MPRGYVKVFQYGSNMNPGRLNSVERLDGKAKTVGVARLDGWGVRFDLYSESNGCGVTDIIVAPDEFVLGVLYEVPTPYVVARSGGRSRMDRIEGAKSDGSGNYEKQCLNVIIGDDTVKAITYIGTSLGRKRFAAKSTQRKQVSHEYFQNLEQGAKFFGLPELYTSYLKEKAGIPQAVSQGE